MEPRETTELVTMKKPRRKTLLMLVVVTLFLVTVIIPAIHNFYTDSPLTAEETLFTVDQGLSIREIALKAEAENIVRSDFVLYLTLSVLHDPASVHAGQYTFSKNDTVYEVAEKLANKETTEDLLSVTFPEGFTVTEFARIAAELLPEFSATEYEAEAVEGYMLPETYFVPERFTATDIADLQRATFDEVVGTAITAASSELSEYEILTLASIIEREANSEESMRLVASVLLNRLAINMPLQADASVEYVLNKPLSELTAEDLKIDTPYNTYLNTGLPPTPIGNPGITSVMAVLGPAESDFFFYITDTTGVFHFAETYAEHNRNIDRYLR